MSRVIVVASGKGGTGKTSFCAGVGSVLALRGHRLLALDTDCGNRNLDLVLGMDDGLLFSLADIIQKRCEAEDAWVEHPSVKGLFMITAPVLNRRQEITQEGVDRLIETAGKEFEYILIDCPAGTGPYIDVFARHADTGVVVTTPDSLSIRGAEIMASQLAELGVPDIRLVVNRVREKLIRKDQASNIDDVMDRTGLRLLGVVPEDVSVLASANAGKLLLKEENSKAMRAYRNIAARILGETIPLGKI